MLTEPSLFIVNFPFVIVPFELSSILSAVKAVSSIAQPPIYPLGALNSPANEAAPVFESKLNVTSPRESVPIIPSSSIVTLSLIAIEPTDISEIFPPIVPLISKLLPFQVRFSVKENVPSSFKITSPAVKVVSPIAQPPIYPLGALNAPANVALPLLSI